ncbi:hypothetical protein K438DRAFT_1770298 [Mycena galopus ATCC 62051]|nr:hypothetical protein K438DRAFT_1770298 [Mycena galopus ATCC 62051]
MFVDHVRLYTRGAHEHGSSLEVAFEQGQVEWSLNTIYLRIHPYLYNLYRFNSTPISWEFSHSYFNTLTCSYFNQLDLLRYLPLSPDPNPSDLSSQILNKYRLDFIPARIIKIPSLNFNANSSTVKYVLVYCIAIPNTRAIHPHPPQISVSVPHQNSVLDLVANNLRPDDPNDAQMSTLLVAGELPKTLWLLICHNELLLSRGVVKSRLVWCNLYCCTLVNRVRRSILLEVLFNVGHPDAPSSFAMGSICNTITIAGCNLIPGKNWVN